MSDLKTSVDADDERNSENAVRGMEDTSKAGSPEIPAKVTKKPNWIQRFLKKLFDPETRFGRFNKSFLRLLVIVLGLFTAGVLVAYYTLYKPTKIQLEDTTATLQETTAQLQDTLGTLDELDASLTDMTTAYDELAEDYAYTTVQNELLRVKSQVVEAQLLIRDENLADARKNLSQAREILDVALPEMKKLNAEDADRLDTRLDLVISEFGEDVEAAQSDLAVMTDWLVQFDEQLQTAMEKE